MASNINRPARLTSLTRRCVRLYTYHTNHVSCFLYSGNDLDSIRALFSEKEKELSLAVAKVEALTRQLEDLRRDRRGPLNLIPGGGGAGGGGQAPNSPAALELDKLRRELMVSENVFTNKLDTGENDVLC